VWDCEDFFQIQTVIISGIVYFLVKYERNFEEVLASESGIDESSGGNFSRGGCACVL
jgi:hypothetical protein